MQLYIHDIYVYIYIFFTFVAGNEKEEKDKLRNGECQNFRMQIKDMIILDDFLFYLANYIPENEKGKYITQLNQLKI